MTDLVVTLGTWGEVAVGVQIVAPDGESWEVVAMQDGYRRIRSKDGREATVPPRTDESPVDVLLSSDVAAMRALVSGLGAVVLASYDNETKQTTCPAYDGDQPGLLEHMRFAHGIDTGRLTAGFEALHLSAHEPGSLVNRGGFPHLHVSHPEMRV